jgi:hypothetical protein
MSKDIGSFVGAKYLDTVGLSSLDLVPLIEEDISESIRVGDLPRGKYYIDVYTLSMSEDSIAVSGFLENEFSDNELEKYSEVVKEIVDEYNYFKGESNYFNRKNRRFFSDEIELNSY